MAQEYKFIRAGQILFTYLHLAANKALAQRLIDSGVTAIAYETVERRSRFAITSSYERHCRKTFGTVWRTVFRKTAGR